jgi:hypothetical protein
MDPSTRLKVPTTPHCCSKCTIELAAHFSTMPILLFSGGFTEDALNYLTGGRSYQYEFPLYKGGVSDSEDWDDMLSLLKRGHEYETAMAFLSAEISSNDNDFSPAELEAKGLCPGHAYSVLSAVELPTGIKLIQLRNPWGSFEWKGAWCDGDSRWTPEVRELCKAASHGTGGGDDGAFFMALDDFKTYFVSVGVCDPFELASGDDSGDGKLDTAIVSGMRVGAGAVATIECGLATELMLTAYQKDARGGDSTRSKVKVSVKCAALGESWLDVVTFAERTYTRTVRLGMEGLQVGSRAPVHSSPPTEEELLDMLLPDDETAGDHNALENLILAKEKEHLFEDLDKLDLKALKSAAVGADASVLCHAMLSYLMPPARRCTVCLLAIERPHAKDVNHKIGVPFGACVCVHVFAHHSGGQRGRRRHRRDGSRGCGADSR